jgi:antitoxin FitA
LAGEPHNPNAIRIGFLYAIIDSKTGGSVMAQLLVRNLDEDVKARLRVLAAEHGRSMEEEVRAILRQAVIPSVQPTGGLGTEIAALFKGIGLHEGEEI